MKVKQCFVFFTITFWVFLAAAVEEPVQLQSGLVSGVELDSGVQVFRGIPFAAPPVGDLRWKAPNPVIPWRGVLEADSFGPVCMQRSERGLMSEDCLYLNVWTNAPSKAEDLPVMVWVHGGGWTSGASNGDTYDGEAFAQSGVVLVSVNYRMGAFGWMAHPALSAESDRGVSGNYGVLDNIAALEWVRDNISDFGGDSSNVTIFGESAGGASIYALLATPLAKGLFHKAIAESVWVPAGNITHLTRGNGFSRSAEELGRTAIDSKLQELGQSSGNDLLSTMRAMSAEEVLNLRLQVSLIEDGWLYPKSPVDIFAEGNQTVVPLLAGMNDGEGLYYLRRNRVFKSIAEQQESRTIAFGEFAGNLLDYYVAKTPAELFDIEVDYLSDSWFVRPTREIAMAMAKSSADSYLYLFTRNQTNPALRSPHAMEMRYVFNNLADGSSATDQAIADLMHAYWVQFATTGSPNGNGLPEWPVYNLENQPHQIIGVEVKPGAEFRKQELDELDRYFRDRYSSAN